jgi:very-short-patch-repair endonuclease
LYGILSGRLKTVAVKPKTTKRQLKGKVNPYFINDEGEYRKLRDVKYIVDFYNAVVPEDVYKIAEDFREVLKTEKATETEKMFKAILKSLKIKYEFQHVIFVDHKGKFFILDFYLPDYNVGIELDGGYHFTHEQLLKDKERTKLILNKIRIRKIIRFKNSSVELTDYFRKKLQRILDTSGLARVSTKEYFKK